MHMLLLYNQSRGIVKIIDENSTGKNEVGFCSGDCSAYCRTGKTVYTCKRDWMLDVGWQYQFGSHLFPKASHLISNW